VWVAVLQVLDLRHGADLLVATPGVSIFNLQLLPFLRVIDFVLAAAVPQVLDLHHGADLLVATPWRKHVKLRLPPSLMSILNFFY
jgi:hypothetical protein